MILSINAPVMKKLLLLSYLFLYLTLGCEKKEVPPTNVASLTNEHFVEIIKINFNEELGGLRRMDKFYLEYFKNSQLPCATQYTQPVFISDKTFNIDGFFLVKTRCEKENPMHYYPCYVSYSMNSLFPLTFFGSNNDFNIMGKNNESQYFSLCCDLNKTNCNVNAGVIRSFDLKNDIINLHAKGRITIYSSSTDYNINTFSYSGKPEWEVSLILDDVKITQTSKRIAGIIAYDYKDKLAVTFTNGLKFYL